MRSLRAVVWSVCVALLIVQTASADFIVYHINGKGGGGGGAGRRSGPPNGMMPGGPGGGMPAGGPGGPGGGAGGGFAPPSPSRSGTSGKIILQGKVSNLSKDTISLDLPTLKERLIFARDEVTVYKAKTLRDEFRNKLSAAKQDPDAMMKAAVFALKKGMLGDFYSTVDKVLDLNPKHESALRVIALKKQIDTALPEDSKTEKALRSVVPISTMRIVKSKHYMLLTDTPEKKEKGKTKNRAEERLELLERVYESFLQFFFAQDIELNVPEERMMVVLFQHEKDYLEYATSISPSLRSALGFWSPLNNVGVFFDQGTSEDFEALNEAVKAVKKLAEDTKKNARSSGGGGSKSGGANSQLADITRKAKMLDVLATIEKENADIKTVSHECVHQLAGNTGLLPRHIDVPNWVHEGLATYFEAPGDATWAGIGAVNELRLTWYRGLEPDRAHSNIKFIATNQIFDFAGSHSSLVHGYGQAWALTHFLMETNIEKFVHYYKMLGEMPSSTPLNPDLLWELFSASVGDDVKAMDLNWRAYMNNLKTDMERQAPEIVED